MFAIWPHGDQSLKLFHEHLSRQHPAIQFTIEEESDGKIPFLDVLVEKQGTGVQISNPTTILESCRECMVKYLKGRADKVCHHTKKSEQIKHLEQVFQTNGFPESSLKRILDGPNRRDSPTPPDDS